MNVKTFGCTEKVCIDCETMKPIEEFYKSSAKSGKVYSAHCKLCNIIRMREWRKKNPEKYKMQTRILK